MPVTQMHVAAAPEAAPALLGALARAPQFSWERGWRIARTSTGWRLLALTDREQLTQAQLLSAGSTAQLLALAWEAAGCRSHVDVLPAFSKATVVHLRDDGPANPRRAVQLLSSKPADRGLNLQASDVRHLNLAAEAHCCELLWQSDLTGRDLPAMHRVRASDDVRPLTTIVSPTDARIDWVRAGRAAAQIGLVAGDLGLAVSFGVHALWACTLRQELRSRWNLVGWPQAQLTFSPS